jgi:hypothetical protein
MPVVVVGVDGIRFDGRLVEVRIHEVRRRRRADWRVRALESAGPGRRARSAQGDRRGRTRDPDSATIAQA